MSKNTKITDFFNFETKEQKLKKQLKNFTNGRKQLTNIINTTQINKQFRNQLLENLLTYHPNRTIKEIEYLIVKIRMPYKTRSLYIKEKNKDVDDISYVLSIKNLFNKYDRNKERKDNIIKAFRNAINDGKRKDFIIQNGIYCCELCKNTNNLHIDHYEIPFKKIFNDYVNIKKLKLENLKLDYENNDYVLRNKKIKNDFVIYHDNIVKYRVLCRKCNCGFGSYGF